MSSPEPGTSQSNFIMEDLLQMSSTLGDNIEKFLQGEGKEKEVSSGSEPLQEVQVGPNDEIDWYSQAYIAATKDPEEEKRLQRIKRKIMHAVPLLGLARSSPEKKDEENDSDEELIEFDREYKPAHEHKIREKLHKTKEKILSKMHKRVAETPSATKRRGEDDDDPHGDSSQRET